MVGAHRGANRVEEPRRQEHAIVREEALELAIEDVGDAVVPRVATRPAVRLHQGFRRLERVPAWIARLSGGGPWVGRVWVGLVCYDSGPEGTARTDHAVSERCRVQ